jgi:long-chain fatty acid transport protein
LQNKYWHYFREAKSKNTFQKQKKGNSMFKRLSSVAIVAAALASSTMNTTAQMGHVMQGAGAVNRAMEGAATGGGTDPDGALYWNVAGLSRMEKSSFSIDAEVFGNRLKLDSATPQMGLRPPMSGSGLSDYGPSVIPSFTFVYIPGADGRDLEGYERSKWTFAIGMQSVAGFGVNHDTDAVNPILNPQNPMGGGFGALSSEFILGQMTFGTAYQVTDKLSLGFAPVLAFSMLEVDPFPGASPVGGIYPTTDMEITFGYGFQFGAMYQVNDDWSVGISHKTTTDFKAFHFDASVGPDFTFDMDMPSITSFGVSYTGINNLMLNTDVRYIDYEHTDGFAEDAEFDSTGAVKGFGWDSIWQIAIGASYKCTEKLTFLCGYSYNENPIDDSITFFNVHAPAVIQHHASLGFAYQATEKSKFKLGWSHGFKNSIEGPMYGMAGPIPGTSTKSEMSTDSLLLGYEYSF